MSFNVGIDDVVELFHLERNPRQGGNRAEYDVTCPFCGGKYKMSIAVTKDTYHCYKCGGGEGGTGFLDLYSRLKYGRPASKDRKELYKQLCEDIGKKQDRLINRRSMPVFQEIYPAPDADVSKIFHVLLNIDALHLSDEHIANLKKRGLSNEAIIHNGYRTFPPAEQLLENWDPKEREHASAFVKERLDRLRAVPKMSRKGTADLTAGYLIASAVTKQLKCNSLPAIPGFFTFDGVPWFNYTTGMLIPTRNTKGEIVGGQYRLDKSLANGMRYLTVSSNGYPGGPSKGIGRTHYPLGNAPMNEDAVVFITEGPLKSDVAVELMRKTHRLANAAFLAIPGVNNVRELPEAVKSLKEQGVTVVCNALDMDQYLNVHVLKAKAVIQKIFEAEEVRWVDIHWDVPFAEQRCKELEKLCLQNGVKAIEFPNGSVWERLEWMVKTLNSKNVSLNELKEWNPNTKGIDDHALRAILKNRG